MKIRILIFIIFSLNYFTIICKTGLVFKPEREQNYDILEKCIQNPESINQVYILPKFDSLGKILTKKLSDDYNNYLIDKIKSNFTEGFDFIFDGWTIENRSVLDIKNKNSFLIKHLIQIKSKKNNKTLLFTFVKCKGKWLLDHINSEEPYETINIHKLTEDDLIYGSENISTTKLNVPISIDAVYGQIDKLIENPDSLLKLLQIVYPQKELTINLIKEFKDSTIKCLKNGYCIIYDQWEKELRIDSSKKITEYYYLHLQSLTSNNFGLPLFFMKKNGVWQFIDFSFKKDPFFRKNMDSR